jgi:uncharacterized membrane-anchored protein
MKRIALIMLTLAALAVFNVAIYRNERLLASGEIMYLELAPVDPRSLMQGDYMRLRYAVERAAVPQDMGAAQQDLGGAQQEDPAAALNVESGYLVVSLDEKRVGRFARFYKRDALAANERLIPYKGEAGNVRVVPDSYMFQEGQAERFAAAKYGEFRNDGAGRQLLVGLADQELKRIPAEAAPAPQ